jgi:hypothetical protein
LTADDDDGDVMTFEQMHEKATATIAAVVATVVTIRIILITVVA